MNRKPLSKRKRFEVFKRDNFQCQYCGRKVPDITLEVDHIIPVSKKGTNEIANLITSCFNCNRGKSNKKLSNKICREDIELINNNLKEKQLQLKEYYKFKEAKYKQIEDDINFIDKRYQELTHDRYMLSDKSKISYKLFLNTFDKYEIIRALEIGYSNNISDFITYSFGILHNWRKDRQC